MPLHDPPAGDFDMTWEIALVIVILIGALVSFALERVPADQTALTVMMIVLFAGLISAEQAFSVFGNPAPITVGAMFVLSAALEKCGLIDRFAVLLGGATRFGYAGVLLVMFVIVATTSAFINNTPVVVIFLPVMINLSRKMGIAASKFLIPLSYAAIAGGTCTLIGTSTNILVSSILVQNDAPPFRMFELASVGVPLAALSLAYILLFGRKLLPNRESLTSILTEDERREYITEAFVPVDSPIAGKLLTETGLLKNRGVRVIDIVRHETPITTPINAVRLEVGDRLVLACRPTGVAHARSVAGLDLVAELNLGLGQISAHEGAIVEGIIGPNSGLIGHSLSESNFRQRFHMIVLAVHRSGRNVREKFGTLPLEFGDTLLMIGPNDAIRNLRGETDILLIDQQHVPAESLRKKAPLVGAIVAATVVVASLGVLPIQVAALAACVLLFWSGCLTISDAYKSVQWNILFLIYGSLTLGLALQETGAAELIAANLIAAVTHFAPDSHKALVLLACIYLMTTVLTEILSNNAAAVVMATLAIGITAALQVDSRPFLVAVTIAASASFATPIGYQTNTYVYGAGGYRFSDFLKIGIPLNLIYFIGSMVLIPRVWPLD
ncbi:MAG TPA: SLC13 family permease [Opitutaceae bacterium]|nr:SLC13 family permease [Opitutaceae bacterium]